MRIQFICSAAVLALVAASLPGRGLAAGQALIAAPCCGESLLSNDGRVAVRLTGLAPGQRVQFLLDGREAAASAQGGRFELEGVERGSHRLAARIVDAAGALLALTPEVDFYVRHASRLIPAQRRR
ncbi:MAG: hypothetical protein KGM91_12445 [Burkholderiales bacterium]|nr:hypothetical protein [Burkholderiales bacterium]